MLLLARARRLALEADEMPEAGPSDTSAIQHATFVSTNGSDPNEVKTWLRQRWADLDEDAKNEMRTWWRQQWADMIETQSEGAISGQWIKTNPCCCFENKGHFYNKGSGYMPKWMEEASSHESKCTASASQHSKYFWFWAGNFNSQSAEASWGSCCKIKFTGKSKACGVQPWIGVEKGGEFDEEGEVSVEREVEHCLSEWADQKKGIDPGFKNVKIKADLDNAVFSMIFKASANLVLVPPFESMAHHMGKTKYLFELAHGYSEVKHAQHQTKLHGHGH